LEEFALGPFLRPKYRVAIEKRTYLSEGDRSIDVGITDVAVFDDSEACRSFFSSCCDDGANRSDAAFYGDVADCVRGE